VEELRRQEVIKEEPRCFRYGGKEHKKWECLQMRKERREKEVALPQNVWRKVKKHSRAKGLPPKGAKMSMEEWMMKYEIITIREQKCRRIKDKGF